MDQTSSESINDRVSDIYALTNQERENDGLVPLEINLELESMAQRHAEYMYKNGECSHDGFQNRSDKAFTMGFRTTAENVAYDSGEASAEGFISQWNNSFWHRVNIMDESFNSIGVGVYGGYAVQYFAGN